MTTTLIEMKQPKQAEIRFSVTEETVRPLASKYLSLKIDGIGDKVGITAVRTARQEVRKARTTVENERVAAKAEYLEAGRKVDASAKAVVAMLEPIEKHLVDQLNWVDAETQRIEDEKLDRRLADRKDSLEDVGGIPASAALVYTDDVVRRMDDARFKAFLVEMTEVNARLMLEEKERSEAEERNRLETERIAAERLELEELRRKEAERQKAERARLDEDRRVENQRLAEVRAAEEKAHAEKLAEQRRIAAEEQKKLDDQRAEQKREAERIEAERQKLADEQAEKEKAARKEARRIEDEKRRVEMMPHREKILAYRDTLLSIPVPNLPENLSELKALIEDLQGVIEGRLTHMATSLEKQ